MFQSNLDKNEGERYFALFIATSGGIGKNLPIMRELLSGEHGIKPLAGQHFYLWCGKRDRRHGVKVRCSNRRLLSSDWELLLISCE